MTATSSRRCSGGGVRAYRGGICPTISDRGRPFSTASTAGPRRASGRACSKPYGWIRTTSGTASTARSTGLTSTPRAVKGGGCAGHRAFARGPLHEGPSARRCARTSADVRDHRGPAPRLPASPGSRCPGSVAMSARGQGLRLGSFPRRVAPAGLPSGHPVEWQPRTEAAVRQGAVQGSFGDRMHLQSAQTSASLRDPLREDPAQLRCRGHHRMRTALAAHLALTLRNSGPA